MTINRRDVIKTGSMTAMLGGTLLAASRANAQTASLGANSWRLDQSTFLFDRGNPDFPLDSLHSIILPGDESIVSSLKEGADEINAEPEMVVSGLLQFSRQKGDGNLKDIIEGNQYGSGIPETAKRFLNFDILENHNITFEEALKGNVYFKNLNKQFTFFDFDIGNITLILCIPDVIPEILTDIGKFWIRLFGK